MCVYIYIYMSYIYTIEATSTASYPATCEKGRDNAPRLKYGTLKATHQSAESLLVCKFFKTICRCTAVASHHIHSGQRLSLHNYTTIFVLAQRSLLKLLRHPSAANPSPLDPGTYFPVANTRLGVWHNTLQS